MTVPRVERPCSVKLAGVKHKLYHPLLPSLRRMDMDDAGHKLPSEHSRTTTVCSRGEFEIAKSTLMTKREPLHCKLVVSKQTEERVRAYRPLATRSYTENWNAIVRDMGSRTWGTSKSQPSTDIGKTALQITGFAMRVKHPSVTSLWQRVAPNSYHGNSILPRPSSAPRLMPAVMYSRYRSGGLRPYSSCPWR